MFCFWTGPTFCDDFSCDRVEDVSHTAMIAESVVYLKKAISQFEGEHASPSVFVRVAPLVTVTTGLLDAGVSPDEPLLQSSLRFLHRFHDDQNSLNSNLSVSDDLSEKIEICLDKARKNSTFPNSNDLLSQYDLSDDRVYLLQSLVSLDRSEAVSRAMEFVQNLSTDENGKSETVVVTDEMQYMASPGFGRSVRFHDVSRVIDEWMAFSLSEHFIPTQFERLIAGVHGLKDYLPLPDEPQCPKPKTFVAVLPTVFRSYDTSVLTGLIESSFSLQNTFEPQQSVLRRYFPADNLAALQTVRHLE